MHKLLFGLASAALLTAPLAMAAPQSSQPQSPAQQQPPAQLKKAPMPSSTELHKFAAAYVDVQGLRTHYMSKLATAKSTNQRTAIEKQATQDMKTRIKKHMPVSEYQKVGKEISANPEARKQLIKIIQADQKKATPPSPGGSGA